MLWTRIVTFVANFSSDKIGRVDAALAGPHQEADGLEYPLELQRTLGGATTIYILFHLLLSNICEL
jgi:hypothetical protein